VDRIKVLFGRFKDNSARVVCGKQFWLHAFDAELAYILVGKRSQPSVLAMKVIRTFRRTVSDFSASISINEKILYEQG
jgi:hypothetical protein